MRIWVAALVSACSFSPQAKPTTSTDSPDAGSSAPADWWNTDFTTRMPITITNGSNAALPIGYQIGLAFDVAGAPCASTAATHPDVRTVYHATEIARVIDEVGPPARTWFRLSAPIAAGATSSGDYWLYCDDPAAPPSPDLGSDVFDFYDPFDQLDTTRWHVNNGAAIAGGMLQCPASMTTGDIGVVTNQSVSALAHAVDFAMIAPGAAANWWGGFQNGAADGVTPWSLWGETITPGSITPVYADASGGEWTGSASLQDAAVHIYTVENDTATAEFGLDDVIVQTTTYAPLDPPPASFDIRLWNDSSQTGHGVSFDWVRLRQAMVPAPTASVGSADHI